MAFHIHWGCFLIKSRCKKSLKMRTTIIIIFILINFRINSQIIRPPQLNLYINTDSTSFSYPSLISDLRVSHNSNDYFDKFILDSFINQNQIERIYYRSIGIKVIPFLKSQISDSVFIFIQTKINKKDTSFKVSLFNINSNKSLMNFDIMKLENETAQLDFRVQKDTLGIVNIDFRIFDLIPRMPLISQTAIKEYSKKGIKLINFKLETLKYELNENNLILKEYQEKFGYGYRVSKTYLFIPVKYDEPPVLEDDY